MYIMLYKHINITSQ